MKPITLHPVSVLAGLALAGVLTVLAGAAQSPGTAHQQTGHRQPVTPTTSHAEPIRLGDGVPKDSMILGETLNAPPGYTSTGWSLTATTGIPPWTTIASMPHPRTDAAAAAVNGRVYVIGGQNQEYVTYPYDLHPVSVATVDEYDPQTDTWTTMPTPMPTPRLSLAVVVVSGRILVTGGIRIISPGFPWWGPPVAFVDEYDPVTDTWSSKSPMLEAQSRHTLVDVDGRIFAVSGLSMEEYDPAADSWQYRAPPIRGAGGAVSANGRIYAFGQQGVAEYDPATDTWTLRSPSKPWTGATPVSVNGRVFLVASDVREYDPSTNTIIFRADNIGIGNFLASMEGFIYTLAGSAENANGDEVPVGSAARFDLGAFQTLYVHRKN